MADEQKPAIHRPITVKVINVSALPVLRELPQDTEITINLKMSRSVALEIVEEIKRQITLGAFVDFVAITITGIS